MYKCLSWIKINLFAWMFASFEGWRLLCSRKVSHEVSKHSNIQYIPMEKFLSSIMTISREIKAQIVTFHQHTSKTQREIAEELQISQSVVCRTIHLERNWFFRRSFRGKSGEKKQNLVTETSENSLLKQRKTLKRQPENYSNRSAPVSKQSAFVQFREPWIKLE